MQSGCACRRFGSGTFVAGFARYDASPAVFVLLVGRPAVPGIMVFVVSRKWPRSSSTTAVVCSMLVLLVTIHFVLCSLVCRQARDAGHHGWYVDRRDGVLRAVLGWRPVQSLGCSLLRPLCAAAGAMVYLAVNMLRQVPAVLFDSGRCLIFCSSPTWWFSSL